MQKILPVAQKNGLLLACVALVCASLSASVYFLTKDRIDEQVALQKTALLAQVVPQTYYDNHLLATCQKPSGIFAQNPYITEICRAEKNGKITAINTRKCSLCR